MSDRLALVGLAGALLVLGTLWFWGRRRALAMLWVGALCFLPVWSQIRLLVPMQPTVYVGLFALALLVADARGRRLPFYWFDGVFALFVLSCATAAFLTGADQDTQTGPLMKWAVGYAVGRTLYSRVGARSLYRMLGYSFGAVAVFAIAEYALQHNVFADIPLGKGNALYALWGGVRLRAGRWRVEAAFGNSIPLAVCFGLTMPMLMTARIRGWVKVFILTLITAALALTLSRIGIVVTVAAVLLMLFARGSGYGWRARLGTVAGLAVALAAALPSLLATMSAAGAEAAESALYRERLWELVSTVQPLGLASSSHVSAAGVQYFGSFRSIDNGLLLTALTYGWVPLLFPAILAAAAVAAYLRGSFNPPLVAVLAHTPALVSVAFITQYEVYFFAVAGMASAVAAEQRFGRKARPATAQNDRSTASERRWAQAVTVP